MLVINAPLFAWFARHRGWWFAARVMPLRVLYYVLNGISVILAVMQTAVWERFRSSRAPNLVAPSGESSNGRPGGSGTGPGEQKYQRQHRNPVSNLGYKEGVAYRPREDH